MELTNCAAIFCFLVTCLAGTFAADIQISPGGPYLLVGLGNEQILHCYVSSDQTLDLNISWTYPKGASVTINNWNDTASTFHSNLTIEEFSQSHVGSYICSYTDEDRQTNKTTIDLIAVQEFTNEDEYSFGNKSSSLACTVRFPPEVQATFLEWQKDGKDLSMLKDHDRFQDYGNGTLMISEPTRNDAGVYIARYNVTGTYGPYYDCEVVYRAAPLVLDMERSKNIIEGDQLDLSCVVKGYPYPNVTWLKDGIYLAQGDRIEMSSYKGIDNAHLTIKSMKFSDEGKYTCEARNMEGQDSKSITIRVKDRIDWLWPIIGIICEVIVLAIIIFICTKLQKRFEDAEQSNDSHPKNQ